MSQKGAGLEITSVCPVSVMIVVRNARRDITEALGSICAQDAPPLEILVVDGMSDDGTREDVERFRASHTSIPIRLLDNRGLIQATGWNVGIRAARGQYILRLDAAHCRIAPDYLRLCLEKIEELRDGDSSVAAIGGIRTTEVPVNQGWKTAIAQAQRSRFGIGGAAYRVGGTGGFCDTLGVPLYVRDALVDVGLFDESLGRSEDNDLHFRLRKAGYKLYFLPAATASYRPRTTLRGLASQMFHNGWWISVTLRRKRSCPFSWRHFAPFLFYGTLVVGLIAGLLGGTTFLLATTALAVVYCAAAVISAFRLGSGHLAWKISFVFLMMHFCYAIGTASGFAAGNGPADVGKSTAPGANH